MKEKRILVIYNPNSGVGVSENVIRKFYKKLRDAGNYVDFYTTKGPNDAKEIVTYARDYDLVFSLGGDGTLNEVVSGNLNREDKFPICPLPTGSCNDFSKMLGYSKDLVSNADRALAGELKAVDIGTINNKAFTYVAGMGKFINICYDTDRNKKSKSGYLAYLKEGIKEFFNDTKKYKTNISVDGVELTGEYSLIIVSNSNHIAGVPGFYKDIKLDDGEFEILLCNSDNRYELLGNFLDFYLNGKSKNMTTIKGKDITIKLEEEPIKNWCIDGEKFVENPKVYHISASNKMDFLVPKNNNQKIFGKSY